LITDNRSTFLSLYPFCYQIQRITATMAPTIDTIKPTIMAIIDVLPLVAFGAVIVVETGAMGAATGSATGNATGAATGEAMGGSTGAVVTGAATGVATMGAATGAATGEAMGAATGVATGVVDQANVPL
jgi:hypothetical protein